MVASLPSSIIALRRLLTLTSPHPHISFHSHLFSLRSTADSHFVALNKQARRDQLLRGGGDDEDEGEGAEGGFSPPCTSSSMQYVETYGDLFRLETWLRIGDLSGVIPRSFLLPPTARGVVMTDSISTQLGALHKCLHMHVILGRADSFVSNYRVLRLPIIANLFKQAEKALKQRVPVTTALPSLLAGVTGFFLFERIFQHCAVYKEGPFSNPELTALWLEFNTRLEAFLAAHLSKLTHPEELLLMKEELLLFSETTNDAIFHSTDVVHTADVSVLLVLSSCWDQFESLQVTVTASRCKLELDGCLYQSLYVESEAQYVAMIKAFHIENLMDDEGRGGGSLGSLGADTSPSLSDSKDNRDGRGKDSNGSGRDDSALFRTHPEGGGAGGADKRAVAPRSKLSMGAAAAALDALEEDLIGTPSPSLSLSPQAIPSFSPNPLLAPSQQPGQSPDSLSYRPDGAGGREGREGRGDDEYRELGERGERKFVPITYPFSSAIPGILKQLHLLVLRYFVFAAKNSQLGVKGEALCASMMKVFRYINTVFKEELERGGEGTPLSKACQVRVQSHAVPLCP